MHTKRVPRRRKARNEAESLYYEEEQSHLIRNGIWTNCDQPPHLFAFHYSKTAHPPFFCLCVLDNSKNKKCFRVRTNEYDCITTQLSSNRKCCSQKVAKTANPFSSMDLENYIILVLFTLSQFSFVL